MTPDIVVECFVTNRATIVKTKRTMTTVRVCACCIFLVINISYLNQEKSIQLGSEVHFLAALKQLLNRVLPLSVPRFVQLFFVLFGADASGFM